VAQEPCQRNPQHRLTVEELEALLSEAEAICRRRQITLHEMNIISVAMSYLSYRQLVERQGAFYDLIYGVENRLN
jgi:hypothetical protein